MPDHGRVTVGLCASVVANSLCSITLAIATVDGEPRVLDIDLARSLGFDCPRDIRKIIARYKANLLKFGICATVAQIHEGAGRPAIEYWLNKQQALFITAKPDRQGRTTSASIGAAPTSYTARPRRLWRAL